MNQIYEAINFNDSAFSVIYHKDTVEKNFFSHVHWHENLELIYVRSETVIFYNGEEIIGKPGDIIAINSNVLHSFKKAKEESAVYDCLILDIKLCNFFGFDIENKFITRIIRDNKASEILKKIIAEINEEKEYFVPAVKFLLGELLVYLYRNYETKNSYLASNKKSIELVKKIISYTEENYKKSISLDELSLYMGYSKYHLAHTFKKSTGLTLIDFINNARIREASRMLKKENMSINEAALACGFENQSYFSKVFKKYMGVSPLKYLEKE